jgi:AcrR family transcriptional regulator
MPTIVNGEKPDETTPRNDSTRQRLLAAARQLFSISGVDGVSVRDIVAAAGARNGASIHYYFGTKEALVQEIVAEGAKLINERRNRMLDAAERGGARPSLRDAALILVVSSFPASDEEELEHEGYLRFIMMLQLTHRQLFVQALQNRWNSGYMRCLDHFRRLLGHLPPAIVEQRLKLMALYLGATLASRESALAGKERGRRLWGESFDIDNLTDTVCGILQQSPARETLLAVSGPATGASSSRKTPSVPR